MGHFWPALLAISLTTAQFCLYVFLSQTPAGAVQTSLQIPKKWNSLVCVSLSSQQRDFQGLVFH